MNEKVRVLFLCTHNAARSQMAEALLRHRAGELFEVASAGFRPTEVHPLTREVLTEVGVDVSALHAKPVREFFGRTSVHYAIIVCEPDEVDCPRHFPFAIRTLYWAFDDRRRCRGILGFGDFVVFEMKSTHAFGGGLRNSGFQGVPRPRFTEHGVGDCEYS